MTTLNKQDARQGKTLHVMRYVLGISLALTIIGLIVVLVTAG